MFYLNIETNKIHDSLRCCDHKGDENICKIITKIEANKLVNLKKAKLCNNCNPEIK